MGARRGRGGAVSVAPPTRGRGGNARPVFSNHQLGASPRPAPPLLWWLEFGPKERGGGGAGGCVWGGGGFPRWGGLHATHYYHMHTSRLGLGSGCVSRAGLGKLPVDVVKQGLQMGRVCPQWLW